MHVGLLIYGRLDTVSGGFIYDRNLVRYLREAGDRVDVISLPWRRYGLSLLDNLNSGPPPPAHPGRLRCAPAR